MRTRARGRAGWWHDRQPALQALLAHLVIRLALALHRLGLLPSGGLRRLVDLARHLHADALHRLRRQQLHWRG